MRYDQKQFTQQGLNLFTNALSQKQSITIDKVIMDNLPTSNLSNLALLTLDDFANAQSFPANYTKVDNNMLTVDSVISNQGFTNSYSANEIGLVGHAENDSNETLIAILVASDPFVLPAQQQGETPLHLIPNVTIQLANNDMQQVPVDTAQDAYVPQNRLDELVSQHNYVKFTDADSRYVKQDDFNHEVNDAVNNKADKSELSNLQSSVNETIEPKLDAKANQSDLESTNDTINSLDITNQDGKLMHAGKPLLTANAPNAPSLSLSIDSNNNNVQYTITPPSIDGGASITNYTLMYQAQGDNGWQTRTLDAGNLVGEFPATQSQTYNVQVSANNYAGSSIMNNMQTILSASTPSINSVNVSPNYPNGINYNVSANTNGANINMLYVYYKKTTDNNWQTTFSNSTNANVQVSDVGYDYQLKFVAQNAVGMSAETDVYTQHYDDSRTYTIYFDMTNGTITPQNFNNINDNMYFNDINWVNNSYSYFKPFYIQKKKVNPNDNKRIYISIAKWHDTIDGWYMPNCFKDNNSGRIVQNYGVNTVQAQSGGAGDLSYYDANNQTGLLDMNGIDMITTISLFFNKTVLESPIMGISYNMDFDMPTGAFVDGNTIYVATNDTKYYPPTTANSAYYKSNIQDYGLDENIPQLSLYTPVKFTNSSGGLTREYGMNNPAVLGGTGYVVDIIKNF